MPQNCAKVETFGDQRSNRGGGGRRPLPLNPVLIVAKSSVNYKEALKYSFLYATPTVSYSFSFEAHCNSESALNFGQNYANFAFVCVYRLNKIWFNKNYFDIFEKNGHLSNQQLIQIPQITHIVRSTLVH